jgi:C4-dicarboxylate-specific signal transduction histidine kinase
MNRVDKASNRSWELPTYRQFFWMILVSVILFLALLYLFTRIGTHRHYRQQEFLTHNLKGHLDQFIHKIEGISQFIAQNKYVIKRINRFPDVSDDQELNRDILTTLYSVKLTTESDIVYIMNTKGVVMASTTYDGTRTLTGQRYRFRPYFANAISGKNAIYPALGVTTNKRGLYFSSPIRSKAKPQPVGVAVVKMGLDKVDELLKVFPGYSGIISTDGIVFASNQPDWLFKAALPISVKRLIQIRKIQQFGNQLLDPLPFTLNQKKMNWEDKNYGIIIQDIAIPGWKVFSIKEISSTFPLFWATIITIIILIIFHLIGLTIISFRKKRIFQKDKERAESEIRSQNEFLYTVLNSLAHPFYIVNVEDYTIVLANKAAGFDLTDKNFNPTCYHFTHKSSVPCGTSEDTHLCPVDLIKKSLKPVTVEHTHLSQDGKPRYNEIHAYPIFNEEGKLIQMIEYNLDITHRKQMEAELLKSQQLESIGILAGGIAHDFNNLLSVIIGNIELVKDELEPEDKNYTFLEHAENNALKAADLSRKLISFSRGGWLQRKKIHFNSILDEVIDTKFSQHKDRMEKQVPDDLIPLFGDVRQLNQVFYNVLQNAMEATNITSEKKILIRAVSLDPTHPEVIEKLEPLYPKQSTYIKITVTDFGTGIPQENKAKIFDPYFSTKQTTDQKGLGLGLTLCYSIVKKHCGIITVESEPGKGTSVDIFLPAFSSGSHLQSK